MRVRLGDFVLDSGSRQLSRDGQPIHLSPKAFEVLCHLVERRPHAITKKALLELVWPNTAVVEANLTVVIAEIRRALGDAAHQPRFIRTVHTHGYAFAGEATDAPAASATSHPASGGHPAPATSQTRRIGLMWEGRLLFLAEGENVIGRDPSCTVWLDVSGVSRRHARVVVQGDDVTIEDLGSTNGTFVGDVAVTSPTPLNDGDVVQLGSAQLHTRIWPAGGVQTERITR